MPYEDENVLSNTPELEAASSNIEDEFEGASEKNIREKEFEAPQLEPDPPKKKIA